MLMQRVDASTHGCVDTWMVDALTPGRVDVSTSRRVTALSNGEVLRQRAVYPSALRRAIAKGLEHSPRRAEKVARNPVGVPTLALDDPEYPASWKGEHFPRSVAQETMPV